MQIYILEKKTVYEDGNYHLDRMLTTSLKKAKELENQGYTLLNPNL